MEITTKLQNGAVVFAEVKIDETHWVAAQWNDGYVTWKVGDDRAAYYGHYFTDQNKTGEDNRRDALADLLKRAGFKTY